MAGDNGVPGARAHALLLGDERGARQLREALAAGARRLVVVGGGLSGVEMAAELAERGASVTLVAAGGVGRFLSTAGQNHLRRTLARLGVPIVEDSVREVRAGEVVLGQETLPCDACVWAGGFSAPSLARESGLDVNQVGQIRVDERLRSLSHPNVYAVGDAAEACFHAGSPILTWAASTPCRWRSTAPRIWLPPYQAEMNVHSAFATPAFASAWAGATA